MPDRLDDEYGESAAAAAFSALAEIMKELSTQQTELIRTMARQQTESAQNLSRSLDALTTQIVGNLSEGTNRQAQMVELQKQVTLIDNDIRRESGDRPSLITRIATLEASIKSYSSLVSTNRKGAWGVAATVGGALITSFVALVIALLAASTGRPHP